RRRSAAVIASWNRSSPPDSDTVAEALIWVMGSIFSARTVDRLERAVFTLQCTIAPIATLATDHRRFRMFSAVQRHRPKSAQPPLKALRRRLTGPASGG